MEEKDGKSQSIFVKPQDLLRKFKTLHLKKKIASFLDSCLGARLLTLGNKCIGD